MAAAVKIDKEFLLKHRFWIALGAFLLVGFLPLLITEPLTIGAAAAAAHKVYDDATKTVEGIRSPPTPANPGGANFANPSWVAPLTKKKEDLTRRKDKVWEAAWKTQTELMTWPSDPEGFVPLDQILKNAYFLDPISNASWRQRYVDTLYLPQFDEFKDAIAPAYYQGEDYRKIIRPNLTWSTTPPPADEMWYAQEDLWIKRDVVRALRAAMDAAATFEPAKVDWKKEAPPSPTARATARFRNNTWEVTIVLEEHERILSISPKSTIKNIDGNERRLPLAGIVLAVDQKAKSGTSRGPVPVVVEGEPLEFGKTAQLTRKWVRADTFHPTDPIQVRQVFNWFTCPLKRLDVLEVANKLAESHRMAHDALKSKKASSAEGGDSGSSAASSGSTPIGQSMPGAPPGGHNAGSAPPGGMDTRGIGPGMTGMGGNAPAGLDKNRYLDFSDQVRRVPVGLVVVVDQGHIPDILTALANSELHIWVTQWQWRHVTGIAPPRNDSSGEAEPTPGGGGSTIGEGILGTGSSGSDTRRMGSGSGAPLGRMTPSSGGGSSGGGTLGRFTPSSGGGSSGGSSRPAGGYGGSGGGLFGGGFFGSPVALGVDEDDPNLVELVVYGIASLYERFPPRQAANASGGQATPPTPTGAPAAPPAATSAPQTGRTGPAGAPTAAAPTTPERAKPAPAAPGGKTTPPAPAGTTAPAKPEDRSGKTTPPAPPGKDKQAAPAAPSKPAPAAPPDKGKGGKDKDTTPGKKP